MAALAAIVCVVLHIHAGLDISAPDKPWSVAVALFGRTVRVGAANGDARAAMVRV